MHTAIIQNVTKKKNPCKKKDFSFWLLVNSGYSNMQQQQQQNQDHNDKNLIKNQ